MYYNSVIIVDRQDSWHCTADFEEEAIKLFKPVDCDNAEDVDEIEGEE